ncbi:MAG: methionyl-tRNA formyltransferase [Dehalococcoidia bacterium]
MTAEGSRGNQGLRVIVYSMLPPGLQAGLRWIARHDHRLLLVVTTAGPANRRNTLYREIVAMLPPEQDILITGRMRRPISLLRSLSPDLILSFGFPYRIPPEVTAIPRLGAYNLHPAPLPSYRGPNPMRMFYDVAPVLGATLPRTEEDFDTGPILSRQERPMPAAITPETVLPLWMDAIGTALEEGLSRAINGEIGTPQDHAQATYAAEFHEDEHWLDWSLPNRTLQARATALNFFRPVTRARIDGTEYGVTRLTPVSSASAAGAPGTLLDRVDGAFRISTADGVVEVTTA